MFAGKVRTLDDEDEQRFDVQSDPQLERLGAECLGGLWSIQGKLSDKRTAATVFTVFLRNSATLRLGPCPREHLKNDAPIYHLRLDEKLNKLEDRDTGETLAM